MRQAELIQACIRAVGGVDNLSALTSIDTKTLTYWGSSKSNIDFNTIASLCDTIGAQLTLRLHNVAERSGAIDLGVDKNAGALDYIRRRYNDSKAIETQRRLMDLYPEGVQIDAYSIHPKGMALGFDIDGNVIQTHASYKNRLSLSHPLTGKKYIYFVF
jgi:hypothetical protein